MCSPTFFLFQGILPIDQLRDHVPCINLMIQHVPVHVLEAKYGLVLQQESQLTCEQLLGAYGVLRQVFIDDQKAVLEILRTDSFLKKDWQFFST